MTVLPYDPARDRVLLIEQMREGPLARATRAGRWRPLRAGSIRARRRKRRRGAKRWRRRGWCGTYRGGAILPDAGGCHGVSYIPMWRCATCPTGWRGCSVAEEAEDIRRHLIAFDALMDVVVGRDRQCAVAADRAVAAARTGALAGRVVKEVGKIAHPTYDHRFRLAQAPFRDDRTQASTKATPSSPSFRPGKLPAGSGRCRRGRA